MKHRQQVDKLAKFLSYVLGRQPDEFGLVPDSHGYVKTKDLLKAMAEESGWRHVRLNHLREVTHASHSPSIELAGHLIRAIDRSSLQRPEIQEDYPKLLYYPIRRRAYAAILQKGVPADPAGNRITLARDQAFAERLGRRIDPSPVILTVHTAKARSHGATLWRWGERLFLSNHLPLGSFSGPPLPKEDPVSPKKERSPPVSIPATPGSFLLDWPDPATTERQFKKSARHRKNEWKRERKRKSRRNGFE